MEQRKTVLVTGASQGIGAAVVNAFVERGYNVVATSRRVSQSAEIKASDRVALVDGDIGDAATAKNVAETAITRFGSIDAVVNNAGIFVAKPFLDYTDEDFRESHVDECRRLHPSHSARDPADAGAEEGGGVVSITTSLSIIRSRALMPRCP